VIFANKYTCKNSRTLHLIFQESKIHGRYINLARTRSVIPVLKLWKCTSKFLNLLIGSRDVPISIIRVKLHSFFLRLSFSPHRFDLPLVGSAPAGRWHLISRQLVALADRRTLEPGHRRPPVAARLLHPRGAIAAVCSSIPPAPKPGHRPLLPHPGAATVPPVVRTTCAGHRGRSLLPLPQGLAAARHLSMFYRHAHRGIPPDLVSL
jgi:hypothetical protein